MADDAPMYGPFFGVMGATAAVVFGGKFGRLYYFLDEDPI